MKHLSGKVAVVTGAAMGMGKCISELLLKEGLLEMDEIQIKKILDVNLASMLWTTKAFLPGMISLNERHVVNIASAGGILALPNLAALAIPSIPVKFLTSLSKLILPVNVMDSLNRLLGMWRVNDSWKGR